MSQSALLEYGKQFLPECANFRYYFELSNNDYTIENVITQLEAHTNINLRNYKYKIVEKENTIGFSMGFHLDDIAPIKTKHNLASDLGGIIIANKYRLYHKDQLPIYSAIIYLSEHEEDFTGGEFEFIDQQIIPKKNWILFFSSKEVHRVLPIKSGIRKNILIKFY